MLIYKITNLITKKVYIGQIARKDKTIERRLMEHSYNSSSCHKLRNSIQKYGIENFTIETIETHDDFEELNKAEVKWIAKYDSVNKGYNITLGGKGTLGRMPSEELKKKMGKAIKIALNKPEVIAKISKNAKKMWECPIHKATISAKIKKIANKPEAKAKQSAKQKIHQNKPEVMANKIEKQNKIWKNKLEGKDFNVYEAIVVRKSGRSGPAIYKKGNFIGTWNNQRQCGKDLNICSKGISACLKNKAHQSYGYVFENKIKGEVQ